MRPIANFTFHAMLAAVLAAVAATSAAAGQARLTLGGGAAAGGGGHIEIESYSWGAAKLQPGGGGAGAAQKDMVMKGSAIGENAPEGRWVPITQRPGMATGDPGRDSQAAKKPKTTTKLLAPGATKPTTGAAPNPTPPGKGSVWIRVSSPWNACRVGAHYPSLELSDGGQSYQLQDVTVASCGDGATEEVAFYYNRIAFNYASTGDQRP